MTEIRYAIVCASAESGESDRIVTLFGPDCGKVRVVVKGARKPKSRLAGSTRPFCEGRFYLERGRGLQILTGAEIARSHKKILAAPPQLALGSLLLEILGRSHWPEDLWTPVFRLSVNALALASESRENAPLRKIACVVWAKLLKLSGEYPDAATCAKCGEPVYKGAAYFDRDLERVHHDVCAPVTASGKPAGTQVTADVCGAIYRLCDLPLAKYGGGWEGAADVETVERLLWRKIESVLGAEMKSRRFLRDALGW